MIGAMRAAVLGGGRWTPRAFGPSLEQWLNPRRLTLSDNDAITSSTDFSGKGNHATQSTTAAKPTFKTNGINGRPAELYSTDDFLIADAVAAIASGDDRPWSVFGVAQMTIISGFHGICSFGRSASASPFHALGFNGEVTLRNERRDDTNVSAVVNLSVPSGITSPLVFGAVFNGTAVTWYRNFSHTTSGALNLGVTTLDRFTWGSVSRGGVQFNFLNGYLGERFVLNRAATSDEATKSITYLMNAYGIS